MQKSGNFITLGQANDIGAGHGAQRQHQHAVDHRRRRDEMCIRDSPWASPM